MDYSAYPGYDTDPRVVEVVERCKKLDLPVFKGDGSPYAMSTLRTKCLVRLLDGKAPIMRPIRKVAAKAHVEVARAPPAALMPTVPPKGRLVKDSKPKYERKAPVESATKFPVGTEMIGQDGRRYIISLRGSGSQYWKPCGFKGADCKGQSYEQSGGSLDLISDLVLNTASKLAVPAALMLAKQVVEKAQDKKGVNQSGGGRQQRGGCGCMSGGGKIQQRGGALSSVLSDPTLNAYLSLNGIMEVTLDTLVPLGVLMTAYDAYSKVYRQKNQIGGGAFSAIGENITKYAEMVGVHVTPQSLVPIALVLGQRAFSTFIASQF